MDRRRRARFLQDDGGLSPRKKMLVFFLFLLLTVVVIRGWMIIVKENNVLYETGGAFATMLLVGSLLYFYNRVLILHRQRLRAIRNATSPQPLDDAEIAAIQERLQLRRVYGENVDFFLQGGHGLSTEIIGNLLKHYTYEKATHGIDCAKILSQRAEAGVDIEHGEGLGAPTIGRPAEEEDLTGFLVQDECAVCLCDFCDGDMLIELPCNHVFHRGCITAWLLSRNLCPMCKQQPVQLGDLTAALLAPPPVTDVATPGTPSPGTPSTRPPHAPVTTVIDAMPAVADRLSEELRLQAERASAVPVSGLAALLPISIGRWFRPSSTGASSEGAPSPRAEDSAGRVRLSSSDLEEERRSSAEGTELAVRYPRSAPPTHVPPAGTTPRPSAQPDPRGAAQAEAAPRMLSISDISDLHSVEGE